MLDSSLFVFIDFAVCMIALYVLVILFGLVHQAISALVRLLRLGLQRGVTWVRSLEYSRLLWLPLVYAKGHALFLPVKAKPDQQN
jgi:hypothetical protein